MVWEGLQDELLRLHGQLAKTILFVTHDIDEAVKLGDAVAVLRTGGVLAQFDPPQRLLAEPADDFVATFVGRDRGYRALSFFPTDGLPVHEVATRAARRGFGRARMAAGRGPCRPAAGLARSSRT